MMVSTRWMDVDLSKYGYYHFGWSIVTDDLTIGWEIQMEEPIFFFSVTSLPPQP